MEGGEASPHGGQRQLAPPISRVEHSSTEA